ncbi:hypothetical protein [Demequina sediminicola]|uniref:hypothetical protein n=1 Tax=Demequina sediminicola TaxID=1095026 RepID=UPI000AF2E7B2|nr:hypothetical protein [Demequina sediminicola]
MRWDDLFDDLEGQAQAAEVEAWRADVTARTRSELADVPVFERLLATIGHAVTLWCRDGVPVRGTLNDVAASWLLIGDHAGREHVVPTGAVGHLDGLAHSTASATVVEKSLTLASVLRGLSRDRARVMLVVNSGTVVGVIQAVGADWCDVRTDQGTTVTVRLEALLRCSSAG